MKGAISYSLFGAGRETPANCFELPSYVRGLMVNIRINRLIYPGWENVIHMDQETYTSKYQPLFDWLIDRGFIEVVICPSNEALTMCMLWRLRPVFTVTNTGDLKYSHTLCRDIDSVCTYREAQAVAIWLQEQKVIHCITDSISHNIPMMGGMIGIWANTFTDRVGAKTWDELISKSSGINFTQKGADQTFLNRYIYPKCADSATEHFVLGMVHNLAEGNGRHYSIEDIPMPIPAQYKAVNDTCGHVGSSGYYENVMTKFLNTIDPHAKEYLEIEKQFPGLFPWSYGK